MFKLFLPLLLTTLLSANLLTTSSKVIALDEPFSVENNGSSLFDTSLSYTHKALLACTPALNAVYKVESDKKIRVIPRQRLKSGTDYSCHYKQIPLTFSTQAFRLVDYHYFKRDKLLRLTFNDTIDLERAKANIKLSKKDKLASTNLNYTITQHSEQTLLLKINEPVGKHAVELTIDKSLGLAEEFSASFNDKQSALVTLDDKRKPMMLPEKPMMVALDNGEFALRLFLGDTLEGTPENFIEIEGVENFRLDSNNYISYTLRKKYDLSEEVYYYTDVLSSEFKPNTTYEVTLKKGLRHYHELKNDQNYTVATTDRAKGIIFEDKKPYISTAGELGFKSVNIESATLIVERVVEDNLRYFMNFSGAKEKKVFKYTEEVYSKEITLDNQKNIITKQKFALADITSKLPYGVYNITLRYTEDEKEKSKSKVVFLSNLGIAVNLAKGQAFITVLSLDKAQPITSAKVELYGENNALIGTVKTNKDGVATINKENLLSSKPKGVIVFYNGDKNFLALNKTITSPSPDSILEKAERFKAHIYFQSKLVRPAGKVNALITIKDKDFISASKLPIKVTFQELYGRVLQEKVYHTDEYGLIDFNHQLDNDDRTGTYELITQIGDKRIGNERVKIESFLPPKIENHISTNKEAYHLGELIEANISSNYLFGAAASGLYGTVTLDSVAVDFEHKAFKHYSFSNHSLAKNNMQIYLEQREEIQLDNNGKLNIVLPTNTQQKVPSVLEAMVGVTIMDDTQPVSNYKKIMLYPYQHMVGVKIDKNHIEKGKELQGKAVLIDPISGKLM
ncbi:MAG: hypothetical protein K0U38_02145, partial [Epsilonproteobacteria bacterium]|nr:hypothetical protein [Campylobacterota bacterium]